MRRRLALAALGTGIAATLLPVTSASAYCDPVTSSVTGHCTNPCTAVGGAYQTADRKAGDRLPDVVFICFD
jgi:hypothetical protein